MEPVDLQKATIIEGIASTQARDSQGETIDLAGADISPLLEGRGFVNSDHRNSFEALVGRVIDAKKIQSLDDCKSPTQVKYWTDQKRPFIWTKIELWDGHGHKEADSIGSIYNFYQTKGEAAPIKLSVEGKTLERGSNGMLKRTLIRGVALTVHPANRQARTEVVGIVKNAGGNEDLVKNEDHEVPIFIEQINGSPVERLYELAITAKNLIKGLTVGKENSESRMARCRDSLEKLRQIRGRL